MHAMTCCGILRLFNNEKWNEKVKDMTVEDVKDTINEGMTKFVPTKTRRMNTKPPWFTKSVQQSVRKKQHLWAAYRTQVTDTAFLNYKAAEKRCRKMVNRA